MTNLLKYLKSEEFATGVGFHLPPTAMRIRISRLKECGELRAKYRSGELGEKQLREFVQDLMSDWCRGEKFPHELALSVLCVALEPFSTKFVEEFALDLARLELSEMRLCIDIARICVRRRCQYSASIYRMFATEDPEPAFVDGSSATRRFDWSATFCEFSAA
jgi:hypothetical protein